MVCRERWNNSDEYQFNVRKRSEKNKMKLILDLWLNADLNDAACDGEDVADDEEDKPAVNKLKPVRPAHFTIQSLLEVAHKLLQNQSNRQNGYLTT